MATISKNKDGKFVVRAKVGSREDNRDIRRIFALRRDAVKFAAKIDMQTGHGKSETGSLISFADYFQRWVLLYKNGKFSKSTDNWYQIAVGYVREYFGSTPLAKVTQMQYQQFINDLGTKDRPTTGRPLAKTTMIRINHYVRTILQDAIDSGIIATDFTRRVEIVGAPGKSPDEKYLSLKDFTNVLALAKEGASLRHMADYVILTQGYTGMRFEEAVGLTWDHVDFEHKTIKLDRSWDYKIRKEFDNFGPLKNSSSYRTVRMPDDLASILKQLRKEQSDYFEKRRYIDRNQLVFRNADFRIISNNAVNATLAGLCKRAKTKRVISSHGLRHTHGSVLIYKGIDLLSISRRLGHQDLQTTLQTYVHEISEMKARDDDKIAEALDTLL